MKIRAGVEVANATDIGCARETNEDYFCYFEPDLDEEFARKGRLAVVADGMGGAEGGEIASRLAAHAVRDSYAAAAAADPEANLIAGFSAAQDAIAGCSRERPELRGMGTTCTAVAIVGRKAYFAHVGDSRLYLLHGGSIFQLTHDHTAVNRLVEAGVITPEEAANHPEQHVLTRALGANSELATDVAQAPIPLEAGDVLVLCTDGLWNMVSNEELHSVIRNTNLQTACRRLIELAKQRHGTDNITVQLLKLNGAAGKEPTTWT